MAPSAGGLAAAWTGAAVGTKVAVASAAVVAAAGGVATVANVVDSGPGSGDDVVLGTGNVQFTLRWDGDADLDLHVRDPDGTELFFENPTSSSGGELDVDACAGGCVPGEERVENVFWPDGEAPAGTYTAWVVNYSGEDASYDLEARVDGDVVSTDSGRLVGESVHGPSIMIENG